MCLAGEQTFWTSGFVGKSDGKWYWSQNAPIIHIKDYATSEFQQTEAPYDLSDRLAYNSRQFGQAWFNETAAAVHSYICQYE